MRLAALTAGVRRPPAPARPRCPPAATRAPLLRPAARALCPLCPLCPPRTLRATRGRPARGRGARESVCAGTRRYATPSIRPPARASAPAGPPNHGRHSGSRPEAVAGARGARGGARRGRCHRARPRRRIRALPPSPPPLVHQTDILGAARAASAVDWRVLLLDPGTARVAGAAAGVADTLDAGVSREWEWGGGGTRAAAVETATQNPATLTLTLSRRRRAPPPGARAPPGRRLLHHARHRVGGARGGRLGGRRQKGRAKGETRAPSLRRRARLLLVAAHARGLGRHQRVPRPRRVPAIVRGRGAGVHPAGRLLVRHPRAPVALAPPVWPRGRRRGAARRPRGRGVPGAPAGDPVRGGGRDADDPVPRAPPPPRPAPRSPCTRGRCSASGSRRNCMPRWSRCGRRASCRPARRPTC